MSAMYLCVDSWIFVPFNCFSFARAQIFIFDASRVERWTDNRSWSKSYSTKAGWLIYKEMEQHSKDSRSRKRNGMNKKIMADTAEGSALRLVCYYAGDDSAERREAAAAAKRSEVRRAVVG